MKKNILVVVLLFTTSCFAKDFQSKNLTFSEKEKLVLLAERLATDIENGLITHEGLASVIKDEANIEPMTVISVVVLVLIGAVGLSAYTIWDIATCFDNFGGLDSHDD